MKGIPKFFYVWCALAVWSSYDVYCALRNGRPFGIAFNIGAAVLFTWVAQRMYNRHTAPVPVKSEDEPDE